ncbi:LuxR C-terminal-related transcriptional regulator [Amycolatopsis nigrescens]|uniref:LuxR C-terminal-related transcriptional regulator n=1 Tax=Amycolatopsis nigrescens TaxID=381445 RepID=UPI00036DEECB|nr:AAA family ATPase [Amycolatopsis nigrescens]
MTVEGLLIEREDEIGLISSALDGEGRLVLFDGPLGIGRSALLAAAAESARVRGVPALRAMGAPAERHIPFGVLWQLLDRAAVTRNAAVREDLPHDLDDAALVRVAAPLLAFAGDGPLLLLVDDLHWADTPSLRWLTALTAAPVPVVVAATCRETEPEVPELAPLLARSARRRTLAPLSVDGVRRAIVGRFGAADDGFVRACHQASRGRPLFLTAMLREHGQERDALESRPAVIGERALFALGGQPSPVWRAAMAAALFDDPPGGRFLAELAGLEQAEGEAALGTLVALGVLTGTAEPEFAHPSIGVAVRSVLTADELTAGHLRAARLLAAEGSSPGAIARHLLAADVAPDEWVAGVLHAAGLEAFERGESERAIRCLRRALLGAGADRAVVLADLAAAERSSAPVAAIRHLSQALPGFGSSRRRAEVLATAPPMLLGVAPRSLTGALTELAAELGDPAAVGIAEGEPALAVQTRSRCAGLTDPVCLADSADRLRVLGAETPLDTPARRDQAAVLLYAATLRGTTGARLSTMDTVDTVLPLAARVLHAGPADLLSAVPLAARSLVAADSAAEAVDWLAPLAARARARSGPGAAETLVAEAELSFALAKACRYGEAAKLAEGALTRCDPELTPVVSRCFETLVVVAMDTQKAFSEGYPAGEHLPVWTRELVRGVSAIGSAEAVTALEHLLECGRELDRMGWANPAVLPWRSWVSVLYHQLGRVDPSHELIAEEHTRALEWGAPSAVGRALRVWGSVTEGAAGLDLFRRAVDVLEGSAATVELAKAQLALGARLRGTDPAEAAMRLRRGAMLAESCGVAGLAPQDGHAEPARTVRAELTRAELRIARLVVAGLANQRIADDLGVSLRAVEKHLTKVYRKLGVPGRAGLVEAAERLERLERLEH